MLTFTFSEGTSVRNIFFISNSEADVPELFLVVWLLHPLCIFVGVSKWFE